MQMHPVRYVFYSFLFFFIYSTNVIYYRLCVYNGTRFHHHPDVSNDHQNDKGRTGAKKGPRDVDFNVSWAASSKKGAQVSFFFPAVSFFIY
jgi:hypothetical protein